MQIHNLIQGSADWHQFRLEHNGASEAAAMLGLSPNVSRTELLHMKHTGTAKEFSDWVQINILDHGHEVEALARPLGEQVLEAELYPVTCSDGKLSASCDGLTMAEDAGWEHKQWNEALAASVNQGIVPDSHMPQVQQELMVTGAGKWLLMVSDGTADKMAHCWVMPDSAWFDRIRAGWAQFAADLAVYEPKNFMPKPAAEPIMQLPALVVQIRGEVTLSNLPVFRAKAEAFIASIKMDLLTDEDFANAEATIKFCDGAEKSIELAKAAAIAQTASIDELMCTVDLIRDQLRAKRLLLTKTVADKKDLLKAGILSAVKMAFTEHVAALEVEIAPIRLVFQARDFAGAMKNKRTLASLHNAVDTELAAGKIMVDALAKAVRSRMTWYTGAAAGHAFLFADLQSIIQKPDDDFKLMVNSRIDAHKARVAAEAEDERVRVQAAADAAAELKVAQANPAGAELSPAAQAINEQQGAERFEVVHPARRLGIVPAAVPTPIGEPKLRLGQITARLGVTLTADFLRTLGFEPAARDGSAQLYHERDFGSICEALVRRIDLARAEAA